MTDPAKPFYYIYCCSACHRVVLVVESVLQLTVDRQEAGERCDVVCDRCNKPLEFRSRATCQQCKDFATKRWWSQDVAGAKVVIWGHDRLGGWSQEREA